MRRKLTRTIIILNLCLLSIVSAKDYFCDVPGHELLIGDFHMHTVFSDGVVWPTVRVDEAQREGIDVISITDHIEYQPHKEDLPTNFNRSFDLAVERAKECNVLLIKGAEITRDTPPGHYNAVYLNDIDLVAQDCAKDEKNVEEKKEKIIKIVAKANEQDAFVFWNHHEWKGAKRGAWMQYHDIMVQNKHLHGMEVANGKKYYPSAFQWCIENNLTMIGNSDIHQPSIEFEYTPEKHRTLTLVFATDRTAQAVKDALKEHKTVVWYNNQLFGNQQLLKLIFNSNVIVSGFHYVNEKGIAFFEVENKSLMDISLTNAGDVGPKTISVPAYGKVIVKMKKNADIVNLKYTVDNYFITPEKNLEVGFSVYTK